MSASELNDTDYQLIARQLTGEILPADAGDLAARMSDPVFVAERERLGRLWQDARVDVSVDVDRAYALLVNRLRSNQATGVAGSGAKGTSRWWRSSGAMLKVAAALLILAASAATVRRFAGSESQPGAVAAGGSEVASAPAERRSETLSDGSTVVLAPGSRLVTRPGFGGVAREVELTGEAAFTVVHDESRPFRVFAGGAMVEDLGTVFVVRAREDEPVRVVVTEGAVTVARRTNPGALLATLAPNDLAVLPDTGDVVVSRKVDVAPFTEWTEGKVVLTFDNQPMRSVAAEVSRWYDVEFELPEDLRDRRVTAPLHDLPIDEVLRVLGTALEVRFERVGRRVRVAAIVRGDSGPAPARNIGRGA